MNYPFIKENKAFGGKCLVTETLLAKIQISYRQLNPELDKTRILRALKKRALS